MINSKWKWTCNYLNVGWGCRLHRLHPCRGVRTQSECPRFYTKQSDGGLGIAEYPFIAIDSRSSQARSGGT